ncbi:hypothetical protein J4Q44_G00354410 [Coregonus suidteri]|uniref:Uncharacterized protein n=1 Tax=Coregonus suidteri TaxID=861788 RepID=A0AAN8KXU2_9TELE
MSCLTLIKPTAATAHVGFSLAPARLWLCPALCSAPLDQWTPAQVRDIPSNPITWSRWPSPHLSQGIIVSHITSMRQRIFTRVTALWNSCHNTSAKSETVLLTTSGHTAEPNGQFVQSLISPLYCRNIVSCKSHDQLLAPTEHAQAPKCCQAKNKTAGGHSRDIKAGVPFKRERIRTKDSILHLQLLYRYHSLRGSPSDQARLQPQSLHLHGAQLLWMGEA